MATKKKSMSRTDWVRHPIDTPMLECILLEEHQNNSWETPVIKDDLEQIGEEHILLISRNRRLHVNCDTEECLFCVGAKCNRPLSEIYKIFSEWKCKKNLDIKKCKLSDWKLAGAAIKGAE